MGGKAERSALFDPTIGSDRKMKFMLGSDGVTLYVHTTGLLGDRAEVMTFRSTTAPRPQNNVGQPANLLGPGPKPNGAAAAPQPTSSLLKPVAP
jgi:hypothetical protein